MVCFPTNNTRETWNNQQYCVVLCELECLMEQGDHQLYVPVALHGLGLCGICEIVFGSRLNVDLKLKTKSLSSITYVLHHQSMMQLS